MSANHPGEISISDYSEFVGRGGGKSPRARRALVASLVLVLCVLCTAAGDYIAPWTGKHSDELSLKDAVRVMSERSEDWAKEIGLYVAHRHLELGMVAMRALGEANPDQARSASGYIRNLCMTGIDHVKALEAVNGAELTQKHLNAIAEKLK